MLGRGGILLCPRGFPAVTVRLKLRDGAAKSPCTCGLDSEIYIDTNAVENEVADDMYQRSELGYLIYNAPLEYANLILNGDPETYLKTVTEYKCLD